MVDVVGQHHKAVQEPTQEDWAERGVDIFWISWVWDTHRENIRWDIKSTPKRRIGGIIVLLTCHQAVDRGQRDSLMMDATVFEEAPELQASHQREAVWGISKTEPAVEPVD